ncbi:MAG: NYN domain-containing protein [Gemmatimonadales bacterium]
MNQYPAHRVGRPAPAPSAAAHHAPNAALLIDFDNVTLGVRSDLTKELRSLLNSEIFKGKVSVQRAYADWRRYPQYIVPLSESSIDLIFAPAFGTNKKNATDIRLAVDAVELVFTRPEIGTFILLSGDSDFSSLVLKLKEYGKYVIGVGIRESASDILIQNCDEYYSYSDLAGLTKESDAPSAQRDPWELVVEAVQRMQRNGDVMRADRLKQVMQQIDENFDEKNVGMNRFSKFVTEAATRGLITITKQDNGQLEVSLPAKGAAAPAAPAPRSSGRPQPRDAKPAATTTTTTAAPAPSAPAAQGEVRPDGERSGRRRRGRGRGRGKAGEEGSVAPAAAAAATDGMPAPLPSAMGLTLAEAFHLMSRALGELPVPVSGETLRARMAALHGKEDLLLDTARFDKLLRQANDAEVADVRALGNDRFEVSPHKSDLAMHRRPAVETAAPRSDGTENVAPPAPAVRFRGGARSPARPGELQMFGVMNLNGGSPIAAVPAVPVVAAPAATPAVVVADAPASAPSSKPARGAKQAKAAAPAKAKPAVKQAKAAAKPKTAKAAPKAAATKAPAKAAAPKTEKKAAPAKGAKPRAT